MTVTEAFWTRGTNIVTVKLRDRKPKITVLIKKSNLKVKNVFIHNDLIWKKRQIKRDTFDSRSRESKRSDSKNWLQEITSQ